MTAPRLVRAVALSSLSAKLYFDQDMGGVSLYDSQSYSFDGGLRVAGVSPVSGHADQVVVYTTGQVDSRLYTIYVSAAVQNVGTEGMDVTKASAQFLGSGSASAYVVQGLVARSGLRGGHITLLWNDPKGDSPNTIAIWRRERSWIFDSTDSATLVYDGAASGVLPDSNGEFQRCYEDTGLNEMTYYYYVVVASPDVGASLGSMVIGPESRTYALSPASLSSKEWLQRKGMIPRHWFKDGTNTESGMVLDTVLTLVGAWLDTMRSNVKAPKLLGRWSDTPYSALGDLNRSIGFEPEGESYDFGTLRRTLVRMSEVFATKGRKVSLQLFTKILVEWDSFVEEFGLYEARRVFATYNPDTFYSLTVRSGLIDPANATYLNMDDVGRTPVWSVNEWVTGRCVDAFGNWLDVVGNTTTSLQFRAPDEIDIIPLTATMVANGYEAHVEYVDGVVVGQRLSMYDPVRGVLFTGEVVKVDGVAKVITFWNAFTNQIPLSVGGLPAIAFSVLSWRVLAPVGSMIGDVATGGVNNLTVNERGGTLQWATNQWVGFYVKDSNGDVHEIVASSANGFTFADSADIPTGTFELSSKFVGSDAKLSYQVFFGDRPTLYNPLYNRALRGTRLDPFTYLYGGYGASLRGAWGPCDVGVFITTRSAVVYKGRVSGVTGSPVVTIVDSTANWTTNELRGMYLNPNQNQTKLFQIVSNTSTEIVVSGEVSRVAVVGQPYVVLTSRNAQRYQRLQDRIREFVEDGVRPHVLFM